MRGWPPLEALLVTAVFLLALVPLWSFTRDQTISPAESIPTTTTEANEETLVFLTAKFVHPPSSFTISHLGTAIWTVENAEGRTEFHGDTSLAIPPDGIDLVVKAQWPEPPTNTAVGLTLEPETLTRQETTVWGPAPMQQVATFAWPR